MIDLLFYISYPMNVNNITFVNSSEQPIRNYFINLVHLIKKKSFFWCGLFFLCRKSRLTVNIFKIQAMTF